MTEPATAPPRIAVSLIRRLDAPPERVFEACTDPRRLVRWLTPGAGDLHAAITDLRVGGCFTLDGCDPDGRAYAISGTYRDIVPDRRLVLTWYYEGEGPLRGPPSLVRIDLRPLGPDLTELTLSHTQIDTSESATRYRGAWAICLERLSWSLTHTAPGAVFRSPLGAISPLYGPRHRVFQKEFGTENLANRLRKLSVTSELSAAQKNFIAGRDMAFLTSIDHRGFPTCSYKGGAAGFVRVVDARTLEVPSYDGNGMYLSAGNLAANPKLGLLFIDFERPHRLRLHGTGQVLRDAAALGAHPSAEFVLRIAIAEVFVNCPRYVHRYRRVAPSGFVPGEPRAGEVPAWKRIDAFGDVLPARDRAALDAPEAGSITLDAYRAPLDGGET